MFCKSFIFINTLNIKYLYIIMSNFVELKFCLYQKGGTQIAEFIPYEEHHLKSEKYKKANPIYCPDFFPFLCNINSKNHGLCKKSEQECNKISVSGESKIIPLQEAPIS